MTAVDDYGAYVGAVEAQHLRLFGDSPMIDPWAPLARTFRFDPQRELDSNLEVVASYVRPEDILVDVGGGAGRVSLPLAQLCREVINVEPSLGMAEQFAASSAEAGITNARLVQARWLEAEGIHGDLIISADTAYFVRDIVPFIEKLEAASRRRVLITLWSIPPPCANAELFQRVYGEEQAPAPGYRQLLPVLWELGILPDVRVMPARRWWDIGAPQTREEAVELALQGSWLPVQDRSKARRRITSQFQELFVWGPQGYRPIWRPDERELLITWETNATGLYNDPISVN